MSQMAGVTLDPVPVQDNLAGGMEYIIIKDSKITYPNTNPIESAYFRSRRVNELLQAARCDLTEKQFVTLHLSLIRELTGAMMFEGTYHVALREMGGTVKYIEFAQFAREANIWMNIPSVNNDYIMVAARNFGVDYDETDILPSEVVYIGESVTATLVGILFLYFVKHLDLRNTEKYNQNRVNSLKNVTQVTTDDAKWVEAHLPEAPYCSAVAALMGSQTMLRRATFNLVKSIRDRVVRDTPIKRAMSVVYDLMKYTDMTHLILIEEHVMRRAPGVFALPIIRNETIAYLRAMKRLLGMGDLSPFAKIIHDSRSCPELNSAGMPALAAVARDLAKADLSSMGFYAANEKKKNDHKAKRDAFEAHRHGSA